MSEFQVIKSTLATAASRRRWERAWRGCWIGLFGTAVLWLVVLGLYKVLPLPTRILAAAGLAGLVLPALGLVIGGWRKSSLEETARWVDLRQHLKERLSTALEISPSGTEWSQLLLRDAALHAQAVDARRLVPFRLPRVTRWALVVLAVAAGLGFVPEYRSRAYLQKKSDAVVIQDVGRHLAELTRRSLTNRPPALEPTLKAMNSVAELGQEMARKPFTRDGALRDLADAAHRLNQEAQKLSKDAGIKPLEKAARDPGGATSSKTAEALQQQMDALQKALGNDQATPDKLDKLKLALDKARKAAAALPDKETPAGQAAREQLAQALDALAQEARDMGHPIEGLEKAVEALKNNEVSQFLKDMDIAAQDIEKLKDMAKAISQLQQQAAKLGKDLAEQLQNGQVGAARQTLEKMAQQMKSAGLNAEQMQKMMDEVSKAVDPAGDYGQVAEHLKEALKQMQQAQAGSEPAKADAAQSLAAAAKDLEQLAQQMSDCQSLAATLDALARAQQAIASGQGWGQGNKAGHKCPHCGGEGCEHCQGTGWADGGALSARGVGTWANDDGTVYYPDQIPQNPVDNSGVDRPDTDPRGHSDRGPGQLTDSLKPTKVQGKLKPGGPMPTINLRNVSIKGQSTVEYKEAVARAQSDAQSALNQDAVPRAYQNAVKEYFDDFKK
jgi:hypothetical protein